MTGTGLTDKTERMREKLLRDRRKTVAQTEQRFATEQGAADLAKARGEQWKRWLTEGDSLVSDMDVSNEAEGWININDNFSSGDPQTPSHPNCRCSVAYRTSEPNSAAQERAKSDARNTAAAQETK